MCSIICTTIIVYDYECITYERASWINFHKRDWRKEKNKKKSYSLFMYIYIYLVCVFIYATFFKDWIPSSRCGRIPNLSSRRYAHYCTCYSYIMVYTLAAFWNQFFFLHLSPVSRFLPTERLAGLALLFLFLPPAIFFSFLT